MTSRRFLKLFGVAAPLALLVGAVTIAAGLSSNNDEPRPLNPDLFGKPGYVFDDPDLELTLTAKITEWEVYPGEVLEAWTYNGQYPGPEIRAQIGDKIRVTFENELPEPSVIHWHGLDVPVHQDGVPGITQPEVAPGETWTYEFEVDRAGTTAYHAHQNTLTQVGNGLFGALIVEDPREPQYDHDITMLLHEIQGNYTINGYAFPKTAEVDPITVKEGETIRFRFINMGNQYHPMHVHGHQLEVLAIDGHKNDAGVRLNTVDVPPGQTVDVLMHADNPGHWVFHCHVISHVQNKGVYPGGMLTLIVYEGWEPHFDATGHAGEPDDGSHADDGHADATDDEGFITIESNDSVFDKGTIEVNAGEEVKIRFVNNDAGVPHNISFYESSAATEVIYEGELFPGVETREITFTAPEPGRYFFKCDVHPTTMTGELIVN